ncbi:MAG TPA: 2-oxoacid:acceptor oxidoreductase subunit alpha [Thermoplasmata archaeon]|nr:2-oxoacid:acceptor oxidoreductase subunit alpha [Thermoplasmata archaeon]
MKEIAVRVGGQAGDGIASIGESIGRSFTRMGLHLFGLNAYQSVIRGGHVWYHARASEQKVYSQGDHADILYALDRQTVDVHAPVLRHGGVVIYDPEKFPLTAADLPSAGLQLLAVPTLEIARKYTSQSILQNAAGLGATAFLAGVPLDVAQKVLADSFGRKAGDVVTWNVGACADGFKFAEQQGLTHPKALAPKGAPLLLMTGNQAIGLGAAAAGLKFLVQYPMTPATSIMHWLAAHSRALGIVVKQSEDELASINMAIGASYSGVRTMTASSGGGFALMTEGLGMAGMAEVPVVVVDAARAGPSTGLPTKTEQADLNLLMGAGQGEWPRAVLAPSNPVEAYRLTVAAFDLTERYQTPVLVLTDFHLAEAMEGVDRSEIDLNVPIPSLQTVEPNGHDYRRYEDTESGVSARALPGQPGLNHITLSDEHDEWGHDISDIRVGIPESIAIREKMMEKRMRKLKGLAKDAPQPFFMGPADAPLTFVAWGSPVGAVRDAMEILREKGQATNLLRFPTLYPLDPRVVHSVFAKTHKTLLVEGNYTGQFAHLLRAETGVELPHQYLKYDGEPFYPERIVERAEEVL